ncbi:sigma factor-like helix-turn-helix DNA-binding protein [Saccharothrix luteola]|uniref:sigma factor-like helix-turn-helix DNA-binding protein n=1 Tax=Saccharothrix luteola TaxID=2893018 RepID=UPI001E4A1B36|nr:sigma factor-like helix-turn-helix DNA-binding protein [Saccharothrix luteola]MCC8245999.1 TIR domain-containing protein [Saccharothrix luteola]
MKVFLSWSGEAERRFALFLREWLQLVVQAVKPWMSDKDIAKGSLSMAELGGALDGTSFGIVVLSAANQHSPWINFEAGALSKSVGQAKVIPLLLDLAKTDVTGPLSQFQAVDAGEKTDVLALLDAVNAALPEPLAAPRLGRFLDREWDDFTATVADFRATAPGHGPVRSDRDVLNEILELTRGLRRATPVPLPTVPSTRPHAPTEAETRALDRLRPGLRAVYVLREIEGLSVAEVAATLGISPSAVYPQLVRARAEIRAQNRPEEQE